MAEKPDKKKPVRRMAEKRSEGRDRHRQKDAAQAALEKARTTNKPAFQP